MKELPLEKADPQFVAMVDAVTKTGDVLVLTRNGREVARVERAREWPPSIELSGEDVESGFAELRARVREHWPDEPEFDWKEAIQSGRR